MKEIIDKLFETIEVMGEPALVNAAGLLMNQGKLDQALKCCEKALQINPYSKKAWNNKGAIFQRLDKVQKALESYDKAIEIDENYKLPWFGKGSILGKLGRYEDELYCYEKALQIDPNFAEALSGKATALDDLGRYEEALPYHDKAISLFPDTAGVWLNRGNTLQNLGRHQEAIQSFKKALKIDNELTEAWGNMANSLRDLKRNEDAIECYDKALCLKPGDPKLYLGKGLAHYLIEQYEMAFYYALKANAFGLPVATQLARSCIEKISPELHSYLSSIADKMPTPKERSKYSKLYGRTLVIPSAAENIEFEKDECCKQCGKEVNERNSFFNIKLAGWICRDCTIASLPDDGKEALKRLEQSEITLELKWDRYQKDTPYYFTYLNDVNMPPFINLKHAKHFIYRYSIYKPVSDLISFWKRGQVHSSITALTHEENTGKFNIIWNKDINQGISEFDVHIRNFNQGILFPNVAMSGLRDLGHVKFVENYFETSAATTVQDANVLSEEKGYAIFARSIAECVILAVHSAIIKNADDQIIARTIKKALVDLLKEEGYETTEFESKWGQEHLATIVNDVKSAIVTDQLITQRFIRVAELFVLALARIN
jgi:Tfp pilus assembly protein PilF/ribosomal protein L37AE/L43A